jgi:hypothetical protein
MYKECHIPNTKQMATLESYSIIRSHASQIEQDTHLPVRTTLKKQEQTTSSTWHTKFQFNIFTAFYCQCVSQCSNNTQKLARLFCLGKKMNEITKSVYIKKIQQ